METLTTIELRAYNSKRDAKLDIFTIETPTEALIVHYNLHKSYFDENTFIYLYDIFVKKCEDLNIEL